MKVKGFIINTDQRAAGLAAMRGAFTKNDVRSALIRAKVPESIFAEKFLADRAADRLCQQERKAGRIRATSNRTWEACGE